MKTICRGLGPLPLLLLLTLLMVLSAGAAMAAELTFGWLPNTEKDLAGYRIHYGTDSRIYTGAVDVLLPPVTDGQVRSTITVPYGSRYFAATAYTDSGVESDYSNEVTAVIPPSSPGGFEVESASVTYYFVPK